jgi:hypothetical protein
MALVKLNNRGVRSATTFGSISTLGSMIFIKKLTASSDSELSFVDGTSDVVLDDTYKEYLFTFNNIHPETDNADFTFNMSTDAGSNYNVTKTTTVATAQHSEAGSDPGLFYVTADDLAQSTAFQIILGLIGNDADQSASGYLTLFNPSSTTFVKPFIAVGNSYYSGNYSLNDNTAGYGNTTSAVDAIRFQMSTGNIDAGDICLYGIN